MANEAPNGFRPMLAASLPSGLDSDLQMLDWTHGFYASPKYDGIRAIKHPEMGLVSRTLKPIPNAHIQKVLNHSIFDRLDGELITGEGYHHVDYNTNQSEIMSRDGEPVFTWNVFDTINRPELPYNARVSSIKDQILDLQAQGFPIRYVEQRHIWNIKGLLAYEEELLMAGWEGLIFRSPNWAYKHGRSTFKQQGMIKLKRFEDAEARIIGFVELTRNTNDSVTDALGYSKRSSHKSGKIPAGILGCFVVVGINGRFLDVEFEVGSGLDADERALVWANKESYLGKIIKYKFQSVGSKDKPRTPIWLGYRDPLDIDIPNG